MTPDIEIRGLGLRYGDTVALDGLTLDLPAGRVYGLLGRNGSGKTSLLSLLAGHRRPATGTLRIAGVDSFDGWLIGTCFYRFGRYGILLLLPCLAPAGVSQTLFGTEWTGGFDAGPAPFVVAVGYTVVAAVASMAVCRALLAGMPIRREGS